MDAQDYQIIYSNNENKPMPLTLVTNLVLFKLEYIALFLLFPDIQHYENKEMEIGWIIPLPIHSFCDDNVEKKEFV